MITKNQVVLFSHNQRIRNLMLYPTLTQLQPLKNLKFFLLIFVLLPTIIARFVPFTPNMPTYGLDPSWMFGLNQAVAQGFSFGKEIIFTFGPYASIFTKVYHPATDSMMMWGSLYLALSYWVCLVLLLEKVRWYWGVVFAINLIALTNSEDTLLFSLPLLIGLVSLKMLSRANGELVRNKSSQFIVLFLFSSLGFLPLIKGTLLILCGTVLSLCSLYFFINNNKKLLILCLFSPLMSMIIYWIIAGQSVASLPFFFANLLPIISGYSDTMMAIGKASEVYLYLTASVIILLIIIRESRLSNNFKIFVFLLYLVFLFISFKAAFVRHDIFHIPIASSSILTAALILPFLVSNRSAVVAILLILLLWVPIRLNSVAFPSDFIDWRLKYYSFAWDGIKLRIENRKWLLDQFDNAMNSLQRQSSFPVFQGTTDIYSTNQSYLISSGNAWSPRPIFQSYSAYTPELAEINKNHLLGSFAPDNIIFKIEPIDRRIPSMEDGASWPILMTNYRPTRMENDFLFLSRIKNPKSFQEQIKIKKEMHVFGESVLLPKSEQPVFASIIIKKTIWGRIVNFLFKPSINILTFELHNGSRKTYKIAPGMMASGFLISPLIDNTTEFGLLYGKGNFLDGKKVKSISISPFSEEKFQQWESEYSITFSQISPRKAIDISSICLLKFNENLSEHDNIESDACVGSIDSVSDFPIEHEVDLKSTLLKVEGRVAILYNKNPSPYSVYVVMTDAQGKHKYLRTRPNGGTHPKIEDYTIFGYSTLADISQLTGKYTLGIAIKQADKLQICSENKFRASIN